MARSTWVYGAVDTCAEGQRFGCSSGLCSLSYCMAVEHIWTLKSSDANGELIPLIINLYTESWGIVVITALYWLLFRETESRPFTIIWRGDDRVVNVQMWWARGPGIQSNTKTLTVFNHGAPLTACGQFSAVNETPWSSMSHEGHISRQRLEIKFACAANGSSTWPFKRVYRHCRQYILKQQFCSP